MADGKTDMEGANRDIVSDMYSLDLPEGGGTLGTKQSKHHLCLVPLRAGRGQSIQLLVRSLNSHGFQMRRIFNYTDPRLRAGF